MKTGVLLTIQGLLGSSTPSALCNPVSDASCSSSDDCIFLDMDKKCQRGIQIFGPSVGYSKSARWDQATGTLVFAVDQSFQGFTTLSFSFTLLNPGQIQAAGSLASISASQIGDFGNLVWDWIALDKVVLSGLGAVLDSNANLRSPKILSCQLNESSNIVGQNNLVRVDMITNVDIPVGSTVMISGLKTMTSNQSNWGSTSEGIWTRVNGVSGYGQWQGMLSDDGSYQHYYPAWYCGVKSWIWNEDIDLYGGVSNVFSDETWCFLPFQYSVSTMLGSQFRCKTR